MSISVPCPGCGKRLNAWNSLAGQLIECPNCGQSVRVPAPEDDAAGNSAQPPTYGLLDDVQPEPAPGLTAL